MLLSTPDPCESIFHSSCKSCPIGCNQYLWSFLEKFQLLCLVGDVSRLLSLAARWLFMTGVWLCEAMSSFFSLLSTLFPWVYYCVIKTLIILLPNSSQHFQEHASSSIQKYATCPTSANKSWQKERTRKWSQLLLRLTNKMGINNLSRY